MEKPAIHALFVRLDMPHLAAVGAFPLRGLGLASLVGRDGGRRASGSVTGDGRGHAAEGGGGVAGWGGGGGHGGRGGDRVDAFGLFALVPAFAVFLQAGELVGDSAGVS
jgi:hypothetical protein